MTAADTADTAAAQLRQQGAAARAAASDLARAVADTRNDALRNIAASLEQAPEQDAILAANAADYRDAEAAGIDAAFLDRLLLTPERLNGMASDVRGVAALPDPVGETLDAFTLDNGLAVEKRRIPPGRYRQHLRKPPQCYYRHCVPGAEIGQRLPAAGGQGNPAFQPGAGVAGAPRYWRGRAAGGGGAVRGQHRPGPGGCAAGDEGQHQPAGAARRRRAD